MNSLPDTSKRRSSVNHAEAVDTMSKTLKEKGYEFVPISELILKDNYEIDTEGRQHKAG